MNALMLDAEAHPPDVELREAMDATRGEGDPVVGPHGARQAELAEGALHPVARGELPFEIGGPEIVRGMRRRGDDAGMVMGPAAPSLFHQAFRARRSPVVLTAGHAASAISGCRGTSQSSSLPGPQSGCLRRAPHSRSATSWSTRCGQ